MPLPYRDFTFPLNVFMHLLTLEGSAPAYLHYGIFTSSGESLSDAQERSTRMLFERLPPPPASILDVGLGLATTLARLTNAGYEAEGITPDEGQIAMARSRYGETLRLTCARFEDHDPGRRYDVVLFQESSQYIESDALFARAAALTSRVIVLDEFATSEGRPLHALGPFLSAAERHGFTKTEDIDLSAGAAHTVPYFLERIPKYRARLVEDLGLAPQQLDDLLVSGATYAASYVSGDYVYRLMQFSR